MRSSVSWCSGEKYPDPSDDDELSSSLLCNPYPLERLEEWIDTLVKLRVGVVEASIKKIVNSFND